MGILLGHQRREIAYVTGTGPDEDLPRARPEVSAHLALSGSPSAAAARCGDAPHSLPQAAPETTLLPDAPGLLCALGYLFIEGHSATVPPAMATCVRRSTNIGAARNDHSSRTPAERGCVRGHRRSVLADQHEYRNLPCGLGLVFADGRRLRDQLRPQLGPGGVVEFFRQYRERLGTHLDGDSGIGLEIVIPVRMGW